MGLGARHGNARREIRHETVGMRRQAVNAEAWADFHQNQRVQTVDGISGVIAAVEDGPFPGAEQYQVVLDHDLGGGTYTASQLTALGPAQAFEVHTADRDYPELGSILTDRPDIAKSAVHRAASEEGTCSWCGQKAGSNEWLGREGCPRCGGTLPFEVEVKNNRVHIDGKPWSHDGGDPQFSSYVDSYQGKGEATVVDRSGKEHHGTGATKIDAAHDDEQMAVEFAVELGTTTVQLLRQGVA
jgi:hypothetical protein